ncbi:outer membrane protein [Bradyrhizobium sp. TZ2]
MKITVWFAVAGAALGIQGVASAADIAKARPAATYNPCSNARFSGAYLGGNAGAIAYAATRSDRDEYLVGTDEYSLSAIGPTVGVQAGYDWQSCNKVFGIVADWNWADAKTHRQIVPNLIPDDISLHSKMDWFSTIRARAGLAVNDTLFYVTGGVAAAHVSSAVSTPREHFAFDTVRWGLVGGAGAEFFARK